MPSSEAHLSNRLGRDLEERYHESIRKSGCPVKELSGVSECGAHGELRFLPTREKGSERRGDHLLGLGLALDHHDSQTGTNGSPYLPLYQERIKGRVRPSSLEMGRTTLAVMIPIS